MDTDNLILLLDKLTKHCYVKQKYCIDDCKGCGGLRGNHAMSCYVEEAEKIVKQYNTKTEEFALEEVK
jgi:hypothetical protein